MSNILNFLILAIKWLSKPLTQLKTSSGEEKYVTAEIALAAIDLTLAHWVLLHWQYKTIANAKKSDSLKDVHERVKATMAKYEELKGFELSKGNPYLHLMSARAMSREELIAKSGEQVVAIKLSLLNQMPIIILTYNFFKKYKERAGELFIKAESDMKGLVKDNQLPGRFSWNNFVEKLEKEKTIVDFSFMDEYKPVDPDEAESSSEAENSTKEQTTLPETKSSDEKPGDQVQSESAEGSMGI